MDDTDDDEPPIREHIIAHIFTTPDKHKIRETQSLGSNNDDQHFDNSEKEDVIEDDTALPASGEVITIALSSEHETYCSSCSGVPTHHHALPRTEHANWQKTQFLQL